LSLIIVANEAQMKKDTKSARGTAGKMKKPQSAQKGESLPSKKKILAKTSVQTVKSVVKSDLIKTKDSSKISETVAEAVAKKVANLSKARLNSNTSQSQVRDVSWFLNTNGNPGQTLLQITAEEPWYSNENNAQPLKPIEKTARLTVDASKLSLITSAVEAAFEIEVTSYQKAKGSKMSGDQKWINDVLKSGTISDKVAALALVVQESPLHELSALDTLIGLASKKEYRTSQLALEAVKDLLIHNLLPDRRLVPFRLQPLAHPDMTMQHAMYFWFEEQLLQRMELVIIALDIGLKSTIEYFKKQCMDIAAELLMGKPEKEGRFLAMVVNKLGDPSGAVGSKCIELLRNVIRKHPAMKCIVVREVRQLIYRPNLGVRVVHSGIVFLSQVTLVPGDHDVAAQLVECYMSLFEKAVTQDELGSRLLSSLLSGLDRAFPFLNNKEPIAKHVDSLFRIVHSASFSTSSRALMLISHIALSDTGAGNGAAQHQINPAVPAGTAADMEYSRESFLFLSV
jgi:ribosome biogenesis protein MAK21